jgi:hypothetical protein
MLKRLVAAAGLASALTAPAFGDTLTEITTKGIILSIQGMEIPIKYNADGSFEGEAMGMPFAGKWAIKDGKLCTTSDMQPEERCTAYPEGKKSGDEFEIDSEMGPLKIKIN